MAYTPPAGGSVGLSLEGSYTPPSAGSTNLEFDADYLLGRLRAAGGISAATFGAPRLSLKSRPVATQGRDSAVARARSSGSDPPSCSATGCSAALKSRSRGFGPCTIAGAVTISVYNIARRVIWR